MVAWLAITVPDTLQHILIAEQAMTQEVLSFFAAIECKSDAVNSIISALSGSESMVVCNVVTVLLTTACMVSLFPRGGYCLYVACALYLFNPAVLGSALFIPASFFTLLQHFLLMVVLTSAKFHFDGVALLTISLVGVAFDPVWLVLGVFVIHNRRVRKWKASQHDATSPFPYVAHYSVLLAVTAAVVITAAVLYAAQDGAGGHLAARIALRHVVISSDCALKTYDCAVASTDAEAPADVGGADGGRDSSSTTGQCDGIDGAENGRSLALMWLDHIFDASPWIPFAYNVAALEAAAGTAEGDTTGASNALAAAGTDAHTVSIVHSVLERAVQSLMSLSPTPAPAGASDAYYYPTVGIWWYLHGQVFAEYAAYFQLLLRAQPFLYVLPLVARFTDHGGQQRAAVAEGADDVPVDFGQLVMHVMVVVILYFTPGLSLASLCFLVCVLAVHEDEFLMIQHLPLITVVVVACTVAQVLTLHLWVDVGSANANFLFFEGLVLWIMLAVGIVEFISVLARLDGAQKGQTDESAAGGKQKSE